jgi:TRAP-type C4-dicarboxylate transport system permease small subunit
MSSLPADANGPRVGARAGRWRARIAAAWSEARVEVAGVPAEAVGAMERTRPPTIVERVQESLAAVFFFATFVTIGAEVVARYFGHPVVWAIELPTYCFLWAWSFAAGLADWENDQLAFNLLSERLPSHWRAVLQGLADVVIIAAFVAVLPGTLSYLSYAGTQPNVGLPLTQVYGEAGVFVFFAAGALLRARALWRDFSPHVRRRRRLLTGAADHKPGSETAAVQAGG